MGKGHQGKVAVVSGAARGIGQAYAVRLAQDGVKIAIADVREADETSQLIRDAGGEVFYRHCDISHPDEVNTFRDAVLAHYGQVDILVNDAGIYPFKSFEEMTFDEWRTMLAVDLDAVFLMCKAFVPGMKQQKWGRIVNQTSTTFGMVVPNATHYVAAKMGVVGFTRALATELGDFGITVNAIAPGATHTPGMLEAWGPDAPVFKMAKAGQAIHKEEEPGDLVGAVSFLTSDDCAFITGQTLVVDGGMIRV